MTSNDRKFIQYVKEQCALYGIKCLIRPVKYVKLSGNIQCGGWFDETEKQLVCASNRPDFLQILVHEFSHLTQWVDQWQAWRRGIGGIGYVDEWLGGKKVANIRKHLAYSRDLELDNEKRSVKHIKKFNLSINIEDYIRRANAYVLFYNRLFITRKWATNKNSPYSNPLIYNKMPKTFRVNYTSSCSKYNKIFEKAGL